MNDRITKVHSDYFVPASNMKLLAAVAALRADLRRVRLYSGIDAATGPGVLIVARGPIGTAAL